MSRVNDVLGERQEKLFGELHSPVSLEEYTHPYEECDENCGSCVHREECDLCI